MLRKATETDVLKLVNFCFECGDAIRWDRFGLGGDLAGVSRTIQGLLAGEGADLSVVELGGQIEGACSVVLKPYVWNTQALVATEMIWHMRPGFPAGPAKGRWFLRMLDHMLAWARKRGATAFQVNTMWGDQSARKALDRRGVKPFEVAHGVAL